jgi:hypothetical protein
MKTEQEKTSVITEHQLKETSVNLLFVPPSPVTDMIKLDIRGAVINHSNETMTFEVAFYLDKQEESGLLHSEKIKVAAKSGTGVHFHWLTKGYAGLHQIFFVASNGLTKFRATQKLEITASNVRSARKISGAWIGLTHWNEQEGQLWNKDIKLMTDEQWAEMVREMHEVQMDIIIIQELFRNQMYYGKHRIKRDGYHGKAFYPSRLYPGRMPIAAKNPVEAILSEADKHDMHVFLPVGLYAWFDFTKGSLEWHKQVANELYELYGHHPSFYGWYVAEEIFGDLGNDPQCWREIVDFFREFQAYCRQLAPCKPVALAPNCHYVPCAIENWRKLLKHCDIICPFGFGRMPADDISGAKAATLMQKLCDEVDSHLCMDMEVFLFNGDKALSPRPINGVIDKLNRFTNFEKTLCYQFSGLMNAPWASRKPGGEATVKFYTDYQQFLKRRKLKIKEISNRSGH